MILALVVVMEMLVSLPLSKLADFRTQVLTLVPVPLLCFLEIRVKSWLL
jgi:hypothetical protein